LEKLVEIGILFDFYGKLLSKKQYFAIELYYMHDLSIVEIGEEIDVTRQGVFDILKRAEKKLYSYEKNLKLVEKFYSSRNYIEDIKNISEEILEELIDIDKKEDYIIERARSIKNICSKILENSWEVI
jgi:uncharacterized protein